MFCLVLVSSISLVLDEKTKETETLSISQEDAVIKNMLVLHVYHEARGESKLGWAMVVHNVITRVESPRFPGTIPEVLFQVNLKRAGVPCEYDWVCTVDISKKISPKIYNEISKVVEKVLDEEIKNPCPDAYFYYNPKTVKVKPIWAFSDTYVATVGNHVCHKALPWNEYVKRVNKHKNV